MNKYALGTVIGVALVGLIPYKKGSHIRLGFHNYKTVIGDIWFSSPFQYPEGLSRYIHKSLKDYQKNKPKTRLTAAYVADQWQEDQDDYRIKIIFEYTSNNYNETEDQVWDDAEVEAGEIYEFLKNVISPLNISLNSSNAEFNPMREIPRLTDLDTGKLYNPKHQIAKTHLRKR